MATVVKPISELSIAPDGCFAFIDYSAESVSVVYDTPAGESEYLDFEAFSHEIGTLLRFQSIPTFGQTAWSMRVVTDSGDSQLLHWNVYEDNFDAWENIELLPHQFLGFLKSVDTKVINHSTRLVAADNRCDDTMYGPRIYFPTDGIKPSPLDFSLAKQSTLGGFVPLLNVNGVAHITSQSIHKIGMTWRNWPAVTLVSRTLSGTLRLLAEWRDLQIAGLATEDFAKDAVVFLDTLGITEEMIAELKEAEVPMPVERFMRGYGNPRHGFSETGNLPSSIKTHLKKQLRYKTLSALEAQHPSHPIVLATLKSTERKLQQEAVLVFVVNRMPGIDPETVTAQMIKDCINGEGQFSMQMIPPPRPIDFPMIEKARLAARYFDATSR